MFLILQLDYFRMQLQDKVWGKETGMHHASPLLYVSVLIGTLSALLLSDDRHGLASYTFWCLDLNKIDASSEMFIVY